MDDEILSHKPQRSSSVSAPVLVESTRKGKEMGFLFSDEEDDKDNYPASAPQSPRHSGLLF
jgi:hypothetical protein